MKLKRVWDDVDIIVSRQKGYGKVQKWIESQLDKLFDIIYCHCQIVCVEAINATAVCVDCSHKKLMHCEKVSCSLDNCSHKITKTCVDDVTCSVASCSHKKVINCDCTKEQKLPHLELSFIRAQRLKIGDRCAYQMSTEDKKETEKQVKNMKRKGDDQK